jgi:hypothetical protein
MFYGRFYYSYELASKREQLLEYYKYHLDVPRFFLGKVGIVVLYFH